MDNDQYNHMQENIHYSYSEYQLFDASNSDITEVASANLVLLNKYNDRNDTRYTKMIMGWCNSKHSNHISGTLEDFIDCMKRSGIPADIKRLKSVNIPDNISMDYIDFGLYNSLVKATNKLNKSSSVDVEQLYHDLDEIINAIYGGNVYSDNYVDYAIVPYIKKEWINI